MNNSEKQRIRDDLERVGSACNTIELFSGAIEEALELIDACDDIVHCSECKNHGTDYCPVNNTKDYLDDDWYCADGERW